MGFRPIGTSGVEPPEGQLSGGSDPVLLYLERFDARLNWGPKWGP